VAPERVDPMTMLQALRRDPALRYNQSGREFLQWLGSRALRTDEWQPFLDDLSPHCADPVSRLAREFAKSWEKLADELEGRFRHSA
jgi:hypothetical protein